MDSQTKEELEELIRIPLVIIRETVTKGWNKQDMLEAAGNLEYALEILDELE